MRIALVGVACLFAVEAASAQTILKREPHFMPPGAAVLVDDGRCTTGKVTRVLMDHRGMTRRKSCVPLLPKQASATPVVIEY